MLLKIISGQLNTGGSACAPTDATMLKSSRPQENEQDEPPPTPPAFSPRRYNLAPKLQPVPEEQTERARLARRQLSGKAFTRAYYFIAAKINRIMGGLMLAELCL